MGYFENNKDIGPLLLRIGFVITLLFSIKIKFTKTEKIVGIFNTVRGLGWLASNAGVMIVAIILLILSLMLLFGYYPRLAGGLLVIFFAVTILSTLGTPVFDKVKVWKDFALLGVALYFLYSGSGPYSIHK